MITAGGAGLGRSIAQAFAAAGARVHICDVAEDALASSVASSERIAGSIADVGNAHAVDAWFEQAQAFLGGLDILINNAGIKGPTGLLEDMDPDAWRETMDINVFGQFLCMRRAIPAIKQAGGGSIVCIASSAGVLGYPLRSPYAASKWAVVGLAKSMAMELGGDEIRVNAICPGALEGDRMVRVIADEAAQLDMTPDEVRAIYLRQTSLHTFIDPLDIANMVLFLCSSAGARITGQVIGVDGNTETLRC